MIYVTKGKTLKCTPHQNIKHKKTASNFETVCKSICIRITQQLLQIQLRFRCRYQNQYLL